MAKEANLPKGSCWDYAFSKRNKEKECKFTHVDLNKDYPKPNGAKFFKEEGTKKNYVPALPEREVHEG